MTPSPAGPWTPDQKLRRDATDEDMLGRVVWLNNNGYTDRSEAMAAREFAAAVVAERDRLAREAGEPVARFPEKIRSHDDLPEAAWAKRKEIWLENNLFHR